MSIAFIGPNGAGKSTTIELITGILHPNSGFISVSGLDPHRERKKLALGIGTVFGQKSRLWYHLSARDFLGQRIRCEIAGSLIHSPSIVFLDEPSIGLDIIAKQKRPWIFRASPS